MIFESLFRSAKREVRKTYPDAYAVRYEGAISPFWRVISSRDDRICLAAYAKSERDAWKYARANVRFMRYGVPAKIAV